MTSANVAQTDFLREAEMTEPIELSRLTAVVAPPAAPKESGNAGAVKDVQRRLSVVFPTDYVEICREYGSGRFKPLSGLMLGNPQSPRYETWLAKQLKELTTTRQTLLNGAGDDEFPFPLFPDSTGLLPFARTASHTYLLWRISEDAPCRWPIFAFGADFEQRGKLPSRWLRFDMSLVDFLVGGLEGTIWMPSIRPRRVEMPRSKWFSPEPLW